MTRCLPRRLSRCLAVAALLSSAGIAHAGIVLSQVVVDITARDPTAHDIEVWNDGPDVSYVVAEPAEIQAPGQPDQRRVPIEDPAAGGLLVSPQRLILQPGERQTVRIAAVAPRGPVDRIYRVTIKPVAGPVTASVTALKLLVGYDVLVIYRPLVADSQVAGRREGTTLTLSNAGNSNVEVFDGKYCASAAPASCQDLPARRLYAGESWTQPLPGAGRVTYKASTAKQGTLTF